MTPEPDWPSVLTAFLHESSPLLRARRKTDDELGTLNGASENTASIESDIQRLLDLFARKMCRILYRDEHHVSIVWGTAARLYVASPAREGCMAVPDESAPPGSTSRTGERIGLDPGPSLDFVWGYDSDDEYRLPLSVQVSEPGGDWLRFTHYGTVRSQSWDTFARSVTTISALYRCFCAVVAATIGAYQFAEDAARRRGEIAAHVRELHRYSNSIDELLDRADWILRSVPLGQRDDYRDLAEELLVVVVQAMMGSGWGVRPILERPVTPTDPPSDRRLVVVGRIERLYLTARNQTSPFVRGGVVLARLTQTVRALVSPRVAIAEVVLPRADDAASVRYDALDLLPHWTRLHELLRPLVDLRARATREADVMLASTVWREVFAVTLGDGSRPGALVRLLEVGATSQGLRPGLRMTPSARHQLTLWLAWRVLRSLGDAPDLRGARDVSVATEVAYTLRETLRAVCFAPFRELFHQQAAYLTAAVRRLVEYHAVSIVRVPEEVGVGALLHHLSQPVGSTEDALGHLQHIFEVYVAGHFLLDCCVGGASTLAERLADPETGADSMRKAYTLAALFHDVGHGLHPVEHLQRSTPRRDGVAEAAILVEAELVATARAIAQRFERELRALPDCAFVVEALGELSNAPGDADHALRSVHYMLHRRGVQQVLRASTEGYRVVRDAVRAILLHEQSGPIDATTDPTASLLAYTNAIFPWDPGRALGTQPGEVGRTVHVMAAPVALREPRDAAIELRGIRGEACGMDFIAHLRAPSSDGRAWPEVRVWLQHPLRLDVMTWRIWLNYKRAIERLTEGRGGWRPGVSLRAPMSDPVRAYVPGGTRALLLEVAERPECGELGSLLRRWLAARVEAPSVARDGVAPRVSSVPPQLTEDVVLIGSRGEPSLFLGESDAAYRAFIAVLDHEIRRLLTTT